MKIVHEVRKLTRNLTASVALRMQRVRLCITHNSLRPITAPVCCFSQYRIIIIIIMYYSKEAATYKSRKSLQIVLILYKKLSCRKETVRLLRRLVLAKYN